MKKIIYILFLFFSFQCVHAQDKPMEERIYEAGLSKDINQPIDVKIKKGGVICDTCTIPFLFNSDREFSYVLVGTPHTPNRLFMAAYKVKKLTRGGFTEVHTTPYRSISVFLLPHYVISNGKEINVWRNLRGLNYRFCEYQVLHNNQIVTDWTALENARPSDNYDILLEKKKIGGVTITSPWDGAAFTGEYHLGLNDSLKVLVRNMNTKEVEKSIFIQRVVDKVISFDYIQLPKLADQSDNNLQDFLNANIKTKEAIKGTHSLVFEKDDDKIGIFSFNAGPEDIIEYSFDNARQWQAIKPGNFINSQGRIYLVIDKNVAAGESRDLYLRYQHQPETVHKVTIKAKPKAQKIPWDTIAIVSIMLLLLIATGFYVWNRRQRKKLAALDEKNRDIETRLALLSGQLNPHFLFNSLHAIQGTINSNNINEANNHIGSIATFMRNIMDQGQKEFISLKEELALETDYLQLEQKRKSFRFIMETDEKSDLSQIDFPPLLLQPVLENSVRHAFGQKENPVLKICILSEKYDLFVVIIDNGPGWDLSERKPGHGLGLVNKRIELINEKVQNMSIEMKVESVKNEGVTTTFTFKNWLS